MKTKVSPEGILWCCLFFLLGPGLILLNSYVFNQLKFKFPITFSSLGILGTSITCHVLKKLGIIEIRKEITRGFWLTRIFPLGLLSALAIASGNAVYLYLSVSFTQMLKALSPMYILVCLFCFGVETPKRKVVLVVFIISAGTAIASLGELRFSWTGFMLQSFADLFEASRIVLTQLLLSKGGLTALESIYYIFPATAVSQVFMVLLYERVVMTDPQNRQFFLDYWYLFLLAVSIGIAVNFVGIFVIEHTSGLTMKLIGVVRNNFLILLSIFFLGDITTALEIIGYIDSIAGFIWYVKLTHSSRSTAVIVPTEDVGLEQIIDEDVEDSIEFGLGLSMQKNEPHE